LESTAWQARQFFSLASCSLANAAPETNALKAITARRIRFMSLSIDFNDRRILHLFGNSA
jgi:hypothetical protein